MHGHAWLYSHLAAEAAVVSQHPAGGSQGSREYPPRRRIYTHSLSLALKLGSRSRLYKSPLRQQRRPRRVDDRDALHHRAGTAAGAQHSPAPDEEHVSGPLMPTLV
jgi:hypothetical protein